jgi:hypothetical protein
LTSTAAPVSARVAAPARTVTRSIPTIAARVAMTSTALFVVLLAALHIAAPELAPSWRLISEYEIGQYGWLMRVAFFSLALGAAGVAVAVASRLRSVAGYIGLFFVLLAAAGLTIAGVFETAAVTVAKEAWSMSGVMHGLGAVLAIQSAPIAATLVSWVLPRRRAAWRASRRPLWLTTAAIWLSFAAFLLAGGTRVDGSQGPGDWYGWANRAFILAFSAWLLVVARTAARIERGA